MAEAHLVRSKCEHKRTREREGADYDVCGVDGDVLPGPDDECAEGHLCEHQARERKRRPAKLGTLRMMKPDVTHGRGDGERDDQRAHAMRVVNRNLRRPRGRKYASEDQREVRDRETGFGVPHRSADDDLQINECGRGRGHEPEQVIVNRRVFWRRPARRREKRDRDRHAEEYLRESGVRGRHRRRQEIEDCDAAQRSLEANGSQGRQAQHPHPPAALGFPNPERQHDREEPDAARDEAMAVFVEDSAHHVLHRKREHVPAVAGGPVGHGKA